MKENALAVSPPRRKRSFIIERRQYISALLHKRGKISEKNIKDWAETWTKDRKKEIEEEIVERKKRNLSIKDLEEEKRDLPTVPPTLKAIRTDTEFIEDYENRRIFEKRDTSTNGKELFWYDETRRFGDTRNERIEKNYPQKRQISEVLASLVLGFKKFQIDQQAKGLKPDGEIFNIEDLEKIEQLIRDSCSEETSEQLLGKLKTFWEFSHRDIFLDAGTTTHVFARDYLQYCTIPMYGITPKSSENEEQPANKEDENEEQPVNKIEIITNDRHIFDCLGSSYVDARAVIIGGAQSAGSAAISGFLAERFIKYNRITAGMAIITTSDVCLDHEDGKSYICGSNESVASMKLRFLERTDVRIVVADSSKFHFKKIHVGWRVCAIKKKNIDLVITDKADDKIKKYFKETLKVPLITYADLHPKEITQQEYRYSKPD